MVITAIEKRQGTRYQVDIDYEYWYILDIEVIFDFHLKSGMTVDEDLLTEVRRAADYRKAKERALYLLGSRDHCRTELIRKLRQSVEDDEVLEEVADRMEELGFLNEERYAEKLARHLLLVKKRGERRALYEMTQKGVDSRIASAALDAVPKEEQEDLLTDLVRRKYARYLGDEKGKNKTLQALGRLGHGYYDALHAIETVLNELDEEEDDED